MNFEIRACGGTLIVAVWCKEGLIICADRLTHDAYHDKSTDRPKIYQLTPSAAFAFTGHHELRKNDSSGIAISFPEVILDFSASNSFSSPEYFQGLLKKIDEETIKFYSDFGMPRFYDHLLTMIFFGLDESGSIDSNMIEVRTIARHLEFFVYSGAEDPVKNKSYMVWGNTWAHEKIKDLSDNRFDKIRANPLIRRFVFNNPTITDVTCQEAESFARDLIIVSSKLTKEYAPESPSPIGDEIDSAVLSFKNGFQWRTRH